MTTTLVVVVGWVIGGMIWGAVSEALKSRKS